MLSALARHTFGAVLLAVMIEELGLPLPVPTDLMIVFAGTSAGLSVPTLLAYFSALMAASAIGGSGLYAIVRHGGRPVVERFGRYVHLGPRELERAEKVIDRGGWAGIAVGRAIPGLRYATVISCGLFKVPYLRYVTAHLVGSSVYIMIFLALGATLGPAILDRLHPPALAMHLLWLLLLAAGLPFLVLWLAARARQRHTPSRGSLLGAVLLGSFAGAAALSATLSATATAAELLGASHPLNIIYTLLSWLIGLGLKANVASLLSYAALLALLVGLGAVYFGLLLPQLVPGGASLPRQVFGLGLFATGVFGLIVLCSLLFLPGGSLGPWWRSGGPVVVLGAGLGVFVYALTAVCGRAIVLAAASTRQDPM